AIDRQCFSPEIAFDEAEISRQLRSRGTVALVAESEENIAGFLIARRSGPNADILTIDVVTAHRRQGVASELFLRAEALLRRQGVRRCRLQVAVANTGAIDFYRKRGYRTLRTLAAYYPDGADAYLMRKDL